MTSSCVTTKFASWRLSSFNAVVHELSQLFHYSDVIMGAMVSQITSLTIVCSTVYQAQIKEYTKAPRHWPLCGEITGHRWIPPHKWLVTQKCYHLMTSSCWATPAYLKCSLHPVKSMLRTISVLVSVMNVELKCIVRSRKPSTSHSALDSRWVKGCHDCKDITVTS